MKAKNTADIFYLLQCLASYVDNSAKTATHHQVTLLWKSMLAWIC